LSQDLSGDIKGIYSGDNINGGDLEVEGKLYIKHNMDNSFVELSILGTEEELYFYRAYLDLYFDSLKITMGKQAIYWGNSYIFNMANEVFNELDLENPKEEGEGINALDFKYNFSNLSRSEFIIFEKNGSSENFALRQTFTIGTFEFMGEYFDYKSSLGKNTRDIILEFKGDIGIGIWSQYTNREVEGARSSIAVMGCDYSLDLAGKMLYIIFESAYRFEDSSGAVYFSYNYSIREDINLIQGFLNGGNTNFITTKLSYLYSDDIDINLIYNYYDNINEYFEGYIGKTEEVKRKFTFEIKAYF
jgi:hypothetical protein